jgi:hypothetical protein
MAKNPGSKFEEHANMVIEAEKLGRDRRQFRRHDLENQDIPVNRYEGAHHGQTFGRIVDISAGGVRIRTNEASVKPENQIRVRLELPAYAGISPFIKSTESKLAPKNEWVGWMSVSRVVPASNSEYEVAGQLIDMDELDRGMLGLYLSTQPLAA